MESLCNGGEGQEQGQKAPDASNGASCTLQLQYLPKPQCADLEI